MPADLDLPVVAAEEVQRAVGAPAGAVARPVHAAARRAERIGDEPLRGQARAAEVAAGEAAAADVELPGDADRDRPQRAVEDVRAGVRVRNADRHGPAPIGLGRPQRRVHRRLGEAVRGDDPQPARPAVDELRLHGLGADDEQRALRQLATGRQRRDERRRQDHVADAMLGEVVRQRRARDPPVRRNDDADAADAERHAEVPHGDVEADRGELRDAAALVDADPVRRGGDQAGDALVRDDDALRPAGRAGRVDDVGGLLERGGPRERDVFVRGRRWRMECRVVEQQRVEPLDRREVGRELGGRDDDPRAAVAQHVGDPVGRVVEVERQVGGARAHDPDQRDDHLRRARDRDRDDVLTNDAARDERSRERGGAVLELGVRQRVRLADDGGRIRIARRAALEGGCPRQLVDDPPARDRQVEHRTPLRRRQQLDRADARVGRAAADGVEHREQPLLVSAERVGQRQDERTAGLPRRVLAARDGHDELADGRPRMHLDPRPVVAPGRDAGPRPHAGKRARHRRRDDAPRMHGQPPRGRRDRPPQGRRQLDGARTSLEGRRPHGCVGLIRHGDGSLR